MCCYQSDNFLYYYYYYYNLTFLPYFNIFCFVVPCRNCAAGCYPRPLSHGKADGTYANLVRKAREAGNPHKACPYVPFVGALSSSRALDIGSSDYMDIVYPAVKRAVKRKGEDEVLLLATRKIRKVEELLMAAADSANQVARDDGKALEGSTLSSSILKNRESSRQPNRQIRFSLAGEHEETSMLSEDSSGSFFSGTSCSKVANFSADITKILTPDSICEYSPCTRRNESAAEPDSSLLLEMNATTNNLTRNTTQGLDHHITTAQFDFHIFTQQTEIILFVIYNL